MPSSPSADGVYLLQSDALSVTALPVEGGRLASLKSRTSGLEFLTQSRRTGEYPVASISTPFQHGPCAGLEECLPTIARCGAEADGGPTPDHGDFWQLPWTVLHSDVDELAMQAQGFSRTLLFRKTLKLRQNALRIRYTIENTGHAAQSFLYACHPLFAVDAGDRIVLPDGVEHLRLDYSRDGRLGTRGERVAWPSPRSDISLDRALHATAGTADMLYAERVADGDCHIVREATGQILRVRFAANRLPSLGVWLCYGGWPDEASLHKQYAVALEPTTAPYNSLAEAQRAGAAVELAPSERYSFEILFSVEDAA